MAQGSTGQTELYKDSLINLELNYNEDINYQKRTAEFLRNIDDKIQLNTQTNQTDARQSGSTGGRRQHGGRRKRGNDRHQRQKRCRTRRPRTKPPRPLPKTRRPRSSIPRRPRPHRRLRRNPGGVGSLHAQRMQPQNPKWRHTKTREYRVLG